MIPYIGGKYRQSKWMGEFLPSNIKEYGEVFGGAMWFYIKSNINPNIAYYNDIDHLMVNLFTCFKKYDIFINKMKDLPVQDKDTFKEMKKRVQSVQTKDFQIPDMDFAIAHAYLIINIFSGFTKDIWRPNLNMTNKKMKEGLIMENHALVKRISDIEIQKKFDILDISELPSNEFIDKVDNEDLFLYVDPPYWETETHYREGTFSKEDHLILLEQLKNSKCKWMLSYYDFDILHDILPESDFRWERKEYKKASGNVKKGVKKSTDEEILIMNY